ncbi:MAG TPA: hypothetical protein DD723_05920 [Candidatus Omnitrophica bacterium]|nr:MAG: hypothetical protein A2Z81_06855 [Omnitrophica WOR_2 bacterium GWA2_45_18]OGX18309.1 MAG: hypothetical protein A2Y04_03575 [Omnitrophica WOR_2 bacterium GWC2_45_7]HBR15062.1 hypothetical protein [Candidatus Omnitrophota bacterium]
MNQQSQHNDSSSSAPAEQDVVVLIKRIQQQLIFLEKKIDVLINQSQARSFSEKTFSKPFRSSGSPHRRPDRNYDNASREKSFDRGRHFEKRQGEEKQGFGYKRKAYDKPRESDSGQERHSEKRYSGEKRGFAQKKKPVYLKRKEGGR